LVFQFRRGLLVQQPVAMLAQPGLMLGFVIQHQIAPLLPGRQCRSGQRVDPAAILVGRQRTHPPAQQHPASAQLRLPGVLVREITETVLLVAVAPVANEGRAVLAENKHHPRSLAEAAAILRLVLALGPVAHP
jgi:hypothetical protein